MIKNKLESGRSVIAIEASEARTHLVIKAGVLEVAVDAAESVSASNSIEKMLVYQMAAAHDLAMRLFARAVEEKTAVEAARLGSTAAKLLAAYQDGVVALHRIRIGGRHVVTVQQVTVAGGQAVIAGTIERKRNGDDGRCSV